MLSILLLTQVVLGMPFTRRCDFSGKILLLRDVSVPSSYLTYPMLTSTSCTLLTSLVVFMLLCRFWKDINTAFCCLFFCCLFLISHQILSSDLVTVIAALYPLRIHYFPNRAVINCSGLIHCGSLALPSRIIGKSLFLSHILLHCNDVLHLTTLLLYGKISEVRLTDKNCQLHKSFPSQ